MRSIGSLYFGAGIYVRCTWFIPIPGWSLMISFRRSIYFLSADHIFTHFKRFLLVGAGIHARQLVSYWLVQVNTHFIYFLLFDAAIIRNSLSSYWFLQVYTHLKRLGLVVQRYSQLTRGTNQNSENGSYFIYAFFQWVMNVLGDIWFGYFEDDLNILSNLTLMGTYYRQAWTHLKILRDFFC